VSCCVRRLNEPILFRAGRPATLACEEQTACS
jgi:hypothetical protein